MMSGAKGLASKMCLLQGKRKIEKTEKKEKTLCTDPIILCAFITEVLETMFVS